MDKTNTYLMGIEKELIQSCMEGDRLSQKQLYEHFADKMFAVCLRYCNQREEAEEILQEGFIQVFKSLKKFRHEGSFEGWVRKIMVFTSIKYFRAKTKMHPVIEIETVTLEDVNKESALEILSKKELLNMVQALSPAYRMVFNLYVFEGMKHREIAALMGISEGTSKSNLFDAKIILQKAVSNSLKIAK